MFEFNVNNYLNGIKNAIFGIEDEDTIPLKLQCDHFSANEIHKYNICDYYITVEGIYCFYREPCYNMFSKDEVTTSTYTSIKKFNYYMNNYENLILPDDIKLDDVIIPFDTTFNTKKFKLYTDVVRYLILNKEKKKSHGEILKYTLPVTVIHPNMTDTFNVYQMNVSDKDTDLFKGLTIAIKNDGQKLELRYGFNTPVRFKLLGQEYDSSNSGMKLLYDTFFLEQRFTLV